MAPVKVALMAPAAACCVEPTNAHEGLLEPLETDRREQKGGLAVRGGAYPVVGFFDYNTMSQNILKLSKRMVI